MEKIFQNVTSQSKLDTTMESLKKSCFAEFEEKIKKFQKFPAKNHPKQQIVLIVNGITAQI